MASVCQSLLTGVSYISRISSSSTIQMNPGPFPFLLVPDFWNTRLLRSSPSTPDLSALELPVNSNHKQVIISTIQPSICYQVVCTMIFQPNHIASDRTDRNTTQHHGYQKSVNRELERPSSTRRPNTRLSGRAWHKPEDRYKSSPCPGWSISESHEEGSAISRSVRRLSNLTMREPGDRARRAGVGSSRSYDNAGSIALHTEQCDVVPRPYREIHSAVPK